MARLMKTFTVTLLVQSGTPETMPSDDQLLHHVREKLVRPGPCPENQPYLVMGADADDEPSLAWLRSYIEDMVERYADSSDLTLSESERDEIVDAVCDEDTATICAVVDETMGEMVHDAVARHMKRGGDGP